MSKKVESVSKYFSPEPPQWGLRGDPNLWKDMKNITVDRPVPATREEFQTLLFEIFENLTGQLPEKGKNFYVDKYDTGGMSRGTVCSDFWIEKAFPLLTQRFNEDGH